MGERPLYRRSCYNKFERATQKLRKKRYWFGKEKLGVVFVQATPNQILKRSVEQIFSEEGFRIRVVERGGRSIKQFLQKSDIRKNKNCGFDSCPVCLSGGSGCSRESVGYRITCCDCVDKHVYHGETGRSARLRLNEHRDKLNAETGALWNHAVEVHDSVAPEYKYEVVKAFSDPLLRQLQEAQRIQAESGVLLNSKDEWVPPAGYRNVVTRM